MLSVSWIKIIIQSLFCHFFGAYIKYVLCIEIDFFYKIIILAYSTLVYNWYQSQPILDHKTYFLNFGCLGLSTTKVYLS